MGKSTFMQRALDLPLPSPTKAADRKIPYDGTLYRIRLLEISIDDVDIDDDDTVSWPASVADRMMPHIDGVLTLYNVADRTSLEDVPETLGKLVACPMEACTTPYLATSTDGDEQSPYTKLHCPRCLYRANATQLRLRDNWIQLASKQGPNTT